NGAIAAGREFERRGTCLIAFFAHTQDQVVAMKAVDAAQTLGADGIDGDIDSIRLAGAKGIRAAPGSPVPHVDQVAGGGEVEFLCLGETMTLRSAGPADGPTADEARVRLEILLAGGSERDRCEAEKRRTDQTFAS